MHCDTQVVMHSSYQSIEEFIREILTSYANDAPSRNALVFKHHPLDRGYTNYKSLIQELSEDLHIQERVFYVHDVSLPKLLKNAKASVMINSTVGLSSLYHNTPVKVMGDAVYNRKGLTFQGALTDFWKNPGKVDTKAVARFRSFLIRNNQVNGNFYKRCDKNSASGLIWSGKLLTEHAPKERVEASVERADNLATVLESDMIASAGNSNRLRESRRVRSLKTTPVASHKNNKNPDSELDMLPKSA